jgi:hypothetical protein
VYEKPNSLQLVNWSSTLSKLEERLITNCILLLIEDSVQNISILSITESNKLFLFLNVLINCWLEQINFIMIFSYNKFVGYAMRTLQDSWF